MANSKGSWRGPFPSLSRGEIAISTNTFNFCVSLYIQVDAFVLPIPGYGFGTFEHPDDLW